MDIWEIIKEIAPYYNNYKNNKDSISWADAIWIMWEIWSILEGYINKLGIAPHKFYREIYWKSEWKTNKAQKSYITREFMWRCYRIKKMFLHKEDIKKQFPTLVSFTAFREAMPFFDNPKYKFKWKEREELLTVLNHSKSGTEALSYVRALQKKYIWIKNSRNQRAWEVDIELFKSFYSDLKSLLEKDYTSAKEEISNYNVSDEILKGLSKNMMSMIDDSFKMQLIEDNSVNNNTRNSIVEFVNKVANESTNKLRRRVRKNVWERWLLQLSRMLTALISEEYFRNYKNNF